MIYRKSAPRRRDVKGQQIDAGFDPDVCGMAGSLSSAR